MKEKNSQKGFIQIPLLIAIIVSIIVATGVGYGAIEYNKTSKSVGEAEQLTKEEKYEEAINKLSLAQASFIVEKLTLNKQRIASEVNENEQKLKDKSQYEQGLDESDKGNLKGSIDILSELPESSFYYQKAQTKIEESKRKIVEGELGETKIAKEEAEQKAKEEESAKKIAEQKTKEEESAKKIAEQKTKEEESAKKIAEAKAKQEEFEKNLKEQQLAGKEAEEKMMNADNDGDGLTYREELKLGTSDWNTDSDNDGIIDSKDINPAGGGSNMTQVFNWSYGDHNYKTEAAIHDDWFNYYKAKKPRPDVRSVEYVTYNDPFIKSISNEISKVATDRNNPCKACFATAFVHSISYIDDKYTGYDEYPRYPVETIMQKTGDCEDTSYLTASILEAMNIDTVLILLPGHMAVGVWVDCNNSGTYYKLNDRCYYYIETTGGKDWAIGEIPPDASHTSATLIKIPSGETINNISPQYKKPCYSSPDFPGYYSDGKDFYSDSQCNYQITCLPYKEYSFDTNSKSLYWDDSCSQIVVKGCSKSTTYSGYFYNGIDFYSDSRCTQKVTLCRPSTYYSDRYYDGYNNYWDSNCTQKVVIGCYKSKNYPGYFYKSGSAWYYDSQCTQSYQSMSCDYPSSLGYSCTSEYSYSSKKSTCDFYASYEFYQDAAAKCYAELPKCRSDIDEYQAKLNEYNQCTARKEY